MVSPTSELVRGTGSRRTKTQSGLRKPEQHRWPVLLKHEHAQGSRQNTAADSVGLAFCVSNELPGNATVLVHSLGLGGTGQQRAAS